MHLEPIDSARPRAGRAAPSPRTLVLDSYAAAAELAIGLIGDGVHYTCTTLPAGCWAFSVQVPASASLDALLVLASRAATRSPATAVGAMVSR